MNADSRGTHLPAGPLVAAVGAVVLVVSLFLDWYESLTAFTVFEFVDILLVGCALLIVVQLAGGMGLIKPPVSPAVALIVALFALAVVLIQLVNDPPAVAGREGPERDIGIWLAVGGAALMAAGAVLSTAHISLAIEPRERAEPPPAGPARVDHEAETVREPARPASPKADEQASPEKP
jgi:hypothetical protein